MKKTARKKACRRIKFCFPLGALRGIRDIGLEKIGVLTERTGIVTDEKMKTNVPGVYAAGDVNGKSHAGAYGLS